MPKLALNIFLLGALLFASAGCGPKTSKPEQAAEQQDPRFKNAAELIIKELDSHFSKTGDNLYTALLEGDGLRGPIQEDGRPFYVQVANPKISASISKTLDESDRLNGITWSAWCYVTFSVYRIASAEENQPVWGDWCKEFDGNGIDSPIMVRAVERGGQLKIDPINSLRLGIHGYSWQSAKKVDRLPDSLKFSEPTTK